MGYRVLLNLIFWLDTQPLLPLSLTHFVFQAQEPVGVEDGEVPERSMCMAYRRWAVACQLFGPKKPNFRRVPTPSSWRRQDGLWFLPHSCAGERYSTATPSCLQNHSRATEYQVHWEPPSLQVGRHSRSPPGKIYQDFGRPGRGLYFTNSTFCFISLLKF